MWVCGGACALGSMSRSASRRGSESTVSCSSDDLDLEDLDELTEELADTVLDALLDRYDSLFDTFGVLRSYWSERVDWYPGMRKYSRRELVMDAVLNLLGVLVGAIMLTILVLRTPAEYIYPICIYAFSLETMLICSAAYNSLAWVHRTSAPALIRALKFADHVGIILTIAGSFTTPLLLLGSDGHNVLAAIWTAAFLSIAHKALRPADLSTAELLFFLVLGWAPMMVWSELTAVLSAPVQDLIIMAGLSFTAGTIPLVLHRLEGHTFMWHLFVMAGCSNVYAAHWQLVHTGSRAVTMPASTSWAAWFSR